MGILLQVIFFILLLYIFLITRYIYGWKKIKKTKNDSFSPNVSIVIALRNEEKVVTRLLRSLQSQVYDISKLEIVLVNDHSNDSTLELLKQSDIENIHILDMPKGQNGKKKAISRGVTFASGEIIIASDADCTFHPNWVNKIVSYFANDAVKLVSGPVVLEKQKGILQNFQALEFLSLIVSGAGAIGVKDAIFCNGANMAYRKDVFLQFNDFNDSKTVSGDDVFLLHNLKEKYPASIVFAKDKDVIVRTTSEKNLNSYINQRKRWASKSREYKDFSSIYVSYLVFLTNLCLVFLIFMVILDKSFFNFLCFFYLIKYIVDLVLLYPILKFFKRQDLTKWIFPFEFFYSFYIILLIVLSFTQNFVWKGRVHIK